MDSNLIDEKPVQSDPASTAGLASSSVDAFKDTQIVALKALFSLASESDSALLAARAVDLLRRVLGADRVLIIEPEDDGFGFVHNESVAHGIKVMNGYHCPMSCLSPYPSLPLNTEKHWLPSLEKGTCFNLTAPHDSRESKGRAAAPFHLSLLHSLGHSAALHFFGPSGSQRRTLLSFYFNRATAAPANELAGAEILAHWLVNRLEELNQYHRRENKARLRKIRLRVSGEAPEKFLNVWDHFKKKGSALAAPMGVDAFLLLGPDQVHNFGKRLTAENHKILFKWLEHNYAHHNSVAINQARHYFGDNWPNWADGILAAPLGAGLDRLWLVFFKTRKTKIRIHPAECCRLEAGKTTPSLIQSFDSGSAVQWNNAEVEHVAEAATLLKSARTLRQKIRAEQFLQESEVRRRAILAAIPEIIVMLDKNGICLDAHVPLGFSKSPITKNCVGRPFARYIPDSRRIQFLALFQQCIKEGCKSRLTFSIPRSGGAFHYELSMAAFGEAEAIISIREQTALIEVLNENKLLSLIARRAASPFILTDPEHNIHWVNTAFTKMTGYSEEEVMGRNPRFLQGKDTDRSAVARIREGLRLENYALETLLNYAKDGSPYWIRLEISAYYGEDGQLEGYIGLQPDISELVEKEQRLEHNLRKTERLNDLIETASRLGRLGHWEIFTDGSLPIWSAMTYEIHGIPMDTPLTLESAINAYAPEYREMVANNVTSAMAKRSGFDFEAEIITPAGKKVWVRAIGIPTFYKTGALSGMRGAVQDITVEKKSIEAIENERKLFAGGPVAALTWLPGKEQVIEYVSRNVQTILGFTPTEMQSKPFIFEKKVHPGDRDRVRREGSTFLEQQKPFFELSYRLLQKDGSYRWIYDFTVPEYDSSGKACRFRSYLLDQTQLKKAELAVRERDSQFSAFADQVPGVVFRMQKRRGKPLSLKFISAGITTLTGLSAQDALKRPQLLLKYIDASNSNAFFKALKSSMRTGKIIDTEFKWNQEGAPERWIRIKADPMHNASAGITWNGYIEDVSQKKLEQAQLMTAGKRDAIERMAGGIAHDFNNYLASISLSAELILTQKNLPEKVRKLASTLDHEIRAASAVARQLLAFSKEQPLHFENIYIQNFLEECLSFALRGSATDYALSMDDNQLRFPTDPGLLHQAIINLVLNAREAINNQGAITLAVSMTVEGLLQIKISDDGPGISKEQADHIFDAYYTTKATGSGLGLHVVSGILSRLNGSIYLDTTYAGGACFVIELPPAEASEEPVRKKRNTPGIYPQSKRKKPHILLLEDDLNQADLLSVFFGSIELEVEHFIDGTHLLERARVLNESHTVRLCCLLDITVTTGKGGLEIIEALRLAAPDAGILLVSGYSDQWETKATLLKKVNADFLPKPYSLGELHQKMMEVIKHPQVREERT